MLQQAARIASIALILSAASPLAALAQTALKVAPLPEGFARSSAAKVRGLYATSRLGAPEVDSAVQRLTEACGTRLKIVGEELRWKGQRHIYRTTNSLAVYEDVPTIGADEAACTARIELRRTVKGGAGPWRRIRTNDWSAKPDCGLRIAKRRTGKVDGIEATCVSTVDPFQGSVTCVSTQRDLSKNLLLSFSTYSDDGDAPQIDWRIGSVDVNALIDPIVFADFPGVSGRTITAP